MALERLIARLETYIREGIESGVLGPQPELVWRYRPTGPEGRAYDPKFLRLEPSLRHTVVFSVLKVVNDSAAWPEVERADEAVGHASFGFRPLVQWLVMESAECLLDPNRRQSFQAGSLVDRAIAALEVEQTRYRATVRLNGIQVKEAPVQFELYGMRVLLRAPSAADYEREVTDLDFRSPFGRPPSPSEYSAIAELDCDANHEGEIQVRVERLVALLRLARPGSVMLVDFDVSLQEPINSREMGMRAAPTPRPLCWANLVPRDAALLETLGRALWSLLGDDSPLGRTLPEDGKAIPKLTRPPLSVAHQRYSDSLLLNGLVERRIASVMMGLESLYLPDESEGELSFRLRLHAAGLLRRFGYDGGQVYRDVRIGYTIRSSYVHGAEMGPDTRRETQVTFGDPRALLDRLIEYLRTSIVIFAMLDLSKETILSRLDQAFVSAEDLLKESTVEPARVVRELRAVGG